LFLVTLGPSVPGEYGILNMRVGVYEIKQGLFEDLQRGSLKHLLGTRYLLVHYALRERRELGSIGS